MSSDKYCSVPGCKESGGTHHVLHGFPNPGNERERFNSWMYAIGGDILGLNNEFVHKYRRVCRSHFEDKYLCRNNRLSKTAVPTLNLTGPLSRTKCPSVSRPLQEKQNESISEPSSSTGLGAPKQCMSSTASFSDQIIEVEEDNIDPETQEIAPVENTGEKQGLAATTRNNTRRLYLTETERVLHSKLVRARIKLRKIKSKLSRQTAEIKAARKLAKNHVHIHVHLLQLEHKNSEGDNNIDIGTL